MADQTAFIDQLRNSLPLAAMIGETVALTHRSKHLRGPCPVHPDRTDGLHVDPVSNNFCCYACGHSGDVVRWVMVRDGLDENATLTKLASLAGIPDPPIS